jgi:hypothetical protein
VEHLGIFYRTIDTDIIIEDPLLRHPIWEDSRQNTNELKQENEFSVGMIEGDKCLYERTLREKCHSSSTVEKGIDDRSGITDFVRSFPIPCMDLSIFLRKKDDKGSCRVE